MKHCYSLLAASLFAAACSLETASAAKLDDNLYIAYSFSDNGSHVWYSVCGSLPQTVGCFAGGELERLDRACAIVEGKPQQKGNIIRRNIYVFDKRRSTDSPALVNVYARTDTITDSDDTVEV